MEEEDAAAERRVGRSGDPLDDVSAEFGGGAELSKEQCPMDCCCCLAACSLGCPCWHALRHATQRTARCAVHICTVAHVCQNRTMRAGGRSCSRLPRPSRHPFTKTGFFRAQMCLLLPPPSSESRTMRAGGCGPPGRCLLRPPGACAKSAHTPPSCTFTPGCCKVGVGCSVRLCAWLLQGGCRPALVALLALAWWRYCRRRTGVPRSCRVAVSQGLPTAVFAEWTSCL